MESSFQFTNPILTDMEMHLNEDFDGNENKQIRIKMNLSFQVTKKNVANEAMVSLTVEIGERDCKVPFWVKAVESANFKWSEEISDSMCDRLLNQNAPSLLLGYLRPIVAQITNASPYGAYNIPFMNFTKNN